MAAERAQTARIDLNKASRDELAGLPGIGPAVADAIVRYRKEHGGFSKLDELAMVPGIGAQTLDGLRGQVSLKGRANGAAAKPAARGQKGSSATAKPVAAKAAEATSVATERGATAVRETARDDAAAGVRAARETAARGAKIASEAASGTAARAGEAASEAGKAGPKAVETAEERTAAAIHAAREAAEEIASQGRSGARAVGASSETMLSGLQELQREWMVYLQEHMRESLDAGRALACARTPQEVVEVQARYARSSWSRFANESSKLANLTMRVVGGSLQPLQASAEEALRRARR